MPNKINVNAKHNATGFFGRTDVIQTHCNNPPKLEVATALSLMPLLRASY